MIEYLKIVLPDNPEFKAHLRKKLAEYTQRIQKIKRDRFQSNPQLSYNSMPGYKKLIIKRLFKTGEVETKKIAAEIKEEFGKIDTKLFNSAAKVIYDYCNTGGKNVTKYSQGRPKEKIRRPI